MSGAIKPEIYTKSEMKVSVYYVQCLGFITFPTAKAFEKMSMLNCMKEDDNPSRLQITE